MYEDERSKLCEHSALATDSVATPIPRPLGDRPAANLQDWCYEHNVLLAA